MSAIAIARGHAQIFVGVVTYISAYSLLGAYYLSTYYFKRMLLLTRIYGIVRVIIIEVVDSEGLALTFTSFVRESVSKLTSFLDS